MLNKPAPEALELGTVFDILYTYVIYPIQAFVDAMDSFYLVGGVSYWELLIYATFLVILLRVVR